MRRKDQRSRDIIDIIRDVVKATSKECPIIVFDHLGKFKEIECPELNYVFGNSRYVKSRLDELSIEGTYPKLPMIALFLPFTEQRGNPDYHAKAKIRILIACSTIRDWSNEQRKEYSFKNILHPIYNSFMKALKADGRLRISYDGDIPHEYSENYSIGRYGLYKDPDDAVSEPIDAINLTNIELIIKNKSCI